MQAEVMRTGLGLLVVPIGVAAVVVLAARLMRSTAADVRREASDPSARRRRQLSTAGAGILATIATIRNLGVWWGLSAPAVGLAVGGALWLHRRSQQR